MAGVYRSIKRRTREIIYYQPSNSSIALSATVSNGSLALGDFEASGFFRCFILGDQIGKNRWGKVFTAAVKGAPEGFKPCRVERVRRWSLKRESKESLFEEVRVLRGLDHPNVIDVYLFYRDDPKYYYLVLEHLEGPELFEHICAKEKYHESDVRKEFEVLLDTIAYIHGEKVVIRNLAPGNILLADPEDDGRIKLVDFSCACSLRNGLVKPTGGNLQFAAPEIINGESHGTSVDMWSLGIMLYILLAAAHPFYDGDTRRMFKKVKAGNLVFGERVWSYISNDAKDLIRGLLNVDPEKRLTASGALEHPWLLLDEEDANEPSILSEDLCRYNAKRKLRAAVFSVMAGRALWRLLPETGFDGVYEMGVRLGKGGYAEVFEATLRCPREGQPMRYAVKRTKRVNDKPTVEMGIRNEADILRSLDHPNIVECYGFFDSEPEYFYLVMELMEGGELYGRITKKKRYNEEEARDVCRILLGAIKYLHDQDVVHRDLKPQNLLLASKTDNTTIRIADFGFSCNLRGGLVRNQKGTPRYVAPEIINRRPYGTSVDMWAIGVIIYQLLCGTYPFNHSTQTRLFTFIRRGEFDFNPELWAGVSEEPKDLIRGLLTVDPERRLTATDALNHPWFIADGQALSVNDLSHTLDSLRLLNAKRKLQSSVKQVVVMQTIAGSS